jgi:choline kinase
MSIKKELLDELNEKQLKELAKSKGVKFTMSDAQKKYYAEWKEKDRLVDMMNDKEDITVKEIEKILKKT